MKIIRDDEGFTPYFLASEVRRTNPCYKFLSGSDGSKQSIIIEIIDSDIAGLVLQQLTSSPEAQKALGFKVNKVYPNESSSLDKEELKREFAKWIDSVIT